MGRLLFSYGFLEIFVEWVKALMEGDKDVTGDPPVPPLGKPCRLIFSVPDP